MRFREFDGSDSDWAASVLPCGSPFQQSAEYAAAACRLGAQVRRFVVEDGVQVVALAQVLGRSFAPWLISRGPVWTFPFPSARQRSDALRALGRATFPLIATPGEPVAGFGLIPLVTARTEAVLALTSSEPDLRAGLDRKWRYRLTRAERRNEPLSLTVPRADDLGWLFAAEGAQRRDRGYRALPPAFAQAWLAAAPQQALLASVGQEAGMLFLIHGASATYQVAWTSDEGDVAICTACSSGGQCSG
jgi:hypothetical protein